LLLAGLAVGDAAAGIEADGEGDAAGDPVPLADPAIDVDAVREGGDDDDGVTLREAPEDVDADGDPVADVTLEVVADGVPTAEPDTKSHVPYRG
jgi:hypothetical protein